MKIIVSLLVILNFVSCKNGTNTSKVDEFLNNDAVYRSTDDSFHKNFFLKVGNEKATVYGWEVSNKNDTIYYRSTSEIEKDSTGTIRITLENYELTGIKITQDNLNDFEENDDLRLPILGAYSTFWGRKSVDGLLDFLAVKHSYFSRSDQFKFVKVK